MFSSGVKNVVHDSCMMIECSQVLVSEGVKGGRRSIFVGLALATSLAMDVDNVIISNSFEWFVSTISTEGGLRMHLFEENVVFDVCLLCSLESMDL